jgi:hypothetical protein
VIWTFPFVWLVLCLPFASVGVIGRVRPLRGMADRHHRITWTLGVLGLCTFLAAFVGLLPPGWTTAAVILGGAVSGFVCFWPARRDDGGDDWRRWTIAPEDVPPPGPPGGWIDWQEFDRLRADWDGGRRVAP